MFARALFPTDFSAYANAVFNCLPALRQAGLSVVVLVSVIRDSDVPLPESVNRESLERVRWSIEEQLNIARLALEGQQLRVITHVEYGRPTDRIVRVAQEERVDLIVIGAQGKSLTEELLLGSVAGEVVRRAPVPVLIQKAQVVRQLGHVRCRLLCEQMFERILHPTDFSDCADAAFQYVKRLRSAGTEEVTILHVQDERAMRHRSKEQLSVFDQRDSERLEALCRTLRMYGLRARYLLRYGIPHVEALRVADEMAPCLIILGSQGRSAVHEVLAGSTFENVVRLGHQPVLVIRQREGSRPRS